MASTDIETMREKVNEVIDGRIKMPVIHAPAGTYKEKKVER